MLFPGLLAVGWCGPEEIKIFAFCGNASQSVVIKDVLKLTRYQGFNENCYLSAAVMSLKQNW